MNIKARIENWLLNKFAGKMVSRLSIAIIGWLTADNVQALLIKIAAVAKTFGISISTGKIDEAELTAFLIGSGLAALEWFKKRRAANPASPAVQTDASKPGGHLSAQEVLAKP